MHAASSGTRVTGPGLDLDHIGLLCSTWAEWLLDRSEELIGVLTGMATRDSAVAELDSAVHVLRGGREEAARFAGRAGGRVCTFLPSNNVLYSYVLFGLMPGLWSDEVLLRPSARTRDVVLPLQELLRDLPHSPVALMDVSQRNFVELCRTAEMVVFTGRYENLLRIRESIPADIPVLGFGSGPNPVVAGPRADVPEVVRATVEARLFNGGQDCLCPDLLIAHTSVYQEIAEGLSAAFGRVPRAPREQPGLVSPALFYADAFDAAAEFVESHRDKVRSGGQVDPHSRWLEPTVLEFPHLAEIHPPELFSPVLCLAGYSEPSEVRAWLESGTERARGMYVSVYGEPALSDPVLGTSVNCGAHTALDAEDGNQPFGGYGERASARWQNGEVAARPLLLSREAGRRPAEEPSRTSVAVR
ncbi:aldehyde dehydrogenase family protein [Streptomyces sp. NPDC088180]|uniref:aldehyde dehydrogenase family protein n=1 Tax=Streptomyces sp. NPDC088180 TaxID=3365837 RepID=UPI00380B2AA1